MTTTPMGLLRQPPTLLIGRGARHSLTTHLPPHTDRALVITDQRMAADPHFRELLRLTARCDIAATVISSVQPEVPVPDVVAAVDTIVDEPDVIIAVGGGSVMDFAKVASVLLTHGGKPQDYYGEFNVPGPAIPMIAVPTTAGTGSEATPVAVLSDPSREMKIGISSPYLIPTAAICDPELTDSAPPSLTAFSGADALSHCIESYTAIRRAPAPALSAERVFIGKSSLVDLYALAGMRTIGRSLRAAVRGSDDRDIRTARDDMMLGALAGGLALGTGGTAAAHALQYPVGALTNSPHGAGIGALLPYVMAFNRPACVDEFAQIAIALGADPALSTTDLSHDAIRRVQDLLKEVDIPSTTAELGVEPGRAEWIADRSLTARRLIDNNPRALDRDLLAAIAAAAHAGDLSLVN